MINGVAFRKPIAVVKSLGLYLHRKLARDQVSDRRHSYACALGLTYPNRLAAGLAQPPKLAAVATIFPSPAARLLRNPPLGSAGGKCAGCTGIGTLPAGENATENSLEMRRGNPCAPLVAAAGYGLRVFAGKPNGIRCRIHAGTRLVSPARWR